MHFLIIFLLFNQDLKETNPIKIVLGTGIRIYQKIVSPGQGDVCNFYPSCSNFAAESINKYGIFWGTIMASDRLMRCNPNTINYYGTFYSEIKNGKIYDPPENNFIISPVNKPFELNLEKTE